MGQHRSRLDEVQRSGIYPQHLDLLFTGFFLAIPSDDILRNRYLFPDVVEHDVTRPLHLPKY